MSHTVDTNQINKIKEVAMCEFINYGYLAASTNRIVKNAGVSKGTLFKYFKSKKALYLQLIGDVNTLIEKHFKNYYICGENWKEKLISYVKVEWLLIEELPLIIKFSSLVYREIGVLNDSNIVADFEFALTYQTENMFRLIELKNRHLQTHLYYFLSGFKMRFFIDHRTETDVAKLKELFITELNEHLSLIENYWREN